MKSKNRINYLIGFWLLYIAIDSFCRLLRAWYTKEMSMPFRFFYSTVAIVRSIVLFLIAFFNFLLIANRSGAAQFVRAGEYE